MFTEFGNFLQPFVMHLGSVSFQFVLSSDPRLLRKTPPFAAARYVNPANGKPITRHAGSSLGPSNTSLFSWMQALCSAH